MGIFACLKNNEVIEIKTITSDDNYYEASDYFDMVVDISELLIPPQIGWMLNGNVLSPPPGQQVSLVEMVKAKIKQYQEEAPGLLRDIYATNTLLGITTAQSDQMFTDFQDVLMRIREGAWPTALYRLQQKAPGGFVTQEMLDSWISTIQSRL